MILKNEENNGTEESGFVISIPVASFTNMV